MKYRKKPVVVEAEQWDGHNLNNKQSLFQSHNVIVKHDNSEFIVSTLEGSLRGIKGDWLIKGVKGEYYPCKPDIFTATYEPA
jgi:hypothetical protein